MESPKYAQSVAAKTHRFRDGMKEAGFTVVGHRDHPICPVMLGDAKYCLHRCVQSRIKLPLFCFRLAAQFADSLLKRGIYVIGFSFPVVPVGKARIRVQISAAHSEADIDAAVHAFKEVGKNLGVI